VNPCANINASVQPSGQRASNRSARARSVNAAGNYQAPNVVALRLIMTPTDSGGNAPPGYVLYGRNSPWMRQRPAPTGRAADPPWVSWTPLDVWVQLDGRSGVALSCCSLSSDIRSQLASISKKRLRGITPSHTCPLTAAGSARPTQVRRTFEFPEKMFNNS
jgi:hypothetical protein